MSPAIMRELSGSSTSVPPFKCAIACEEGLADLLFSQWGVDLKVEYGFWPIRVELSAQLFDAFLLHPDKIIGDWVRNLDFRLGVCQNEKKSLFYFGFLTLARRRIFFCGFWCIKKDLLITKHFIDTELDVYIFFCHMEIYQLLMSNKVITIIIGT